MSGIFIVLEFPGQCPEAVPGIGQGIELRPA